MDPVTKAGQMVDLQCALSKGNLAVAYICQSQLVLGESVENPVHDVLLTFFSLPL
jgi:hypothetical protein